MTAKALAESPTETTQPNSSFFISPLHLYEKVLAFPENIKNTQITVETIHDFMRTITIFLDDISNTIELLLQIHDKDQEAVAILNNEKKELFQASSDYKVIEEDVLECLSLLLEFKRNFSTMRTEFSTFSVRVARSVHTLNSLLQNASNPYLITLIKATITALNSFYREEHASMFGATHYYESTQIIARPVQK